MRNVLARIFTKIKNVLARIFTKMRNVLVQIFTKMRKVLVQIFTKMRNVASIVWIFGRKNLNEKGFVCDNKRNRN